MQPGCVCEFTEDTAKIQNMRKELVNSHLEPCPNKDRLRQTSRVTHPKPSCPVVQFIALSFVTNNTVFVVNNN